VPSVKTPRKIFRPTKDIKPGVLF